jgi:hypothetical protein
MLTRSAAKKYLETQILFERYAFHKLGVYCGAIDIFYHDISIDYRPRPVVQPELDGHSVADLNILLFIFFELKFYTADRNIFD